MATDVFASWVQQISRLLPLHHGLLGTRDLLANGASSAALGELGLELLIGAAWFVMALIGFRTFSEGGRRDGTIDLME